jgi:hypothetical protein
MWSGFLRQLVHWFCILQFYNVTFHWWEDSKTLWTATHESALCTTSRPGCLDFLLPFFLFLDELSAGLLSRHGAFQLNLGNFTVIHCEILRFCLIKADWPSYHGANKLRHSEYVFLFWELRGGDPNLNQPDGCFITDFSFFFFSFSFFLWLC